MKPITFSGQTNILSKPESMTEDECLPLPIYTDGKVCISCWKMTFWERIRALFFGNLWLYVWSGNTQPPVSVTIYKTIFGEDQNE